MTKYIFDHYLIRCITHLHVGSGAENYGVIDNLVQRDATTNVPCIHSSSIKGACREHFENNNPKGIDITEIFGSDSKSRQLSPGKVRFLQAHLLSLPVRSSGKPFHNCTSKEHLKQLTSTLSSCALPDNFIKVLNTIIQLGSENNFLFGTEEVRWIEDQEVSKIEPAISELHKTDITKYLGENAAVLSDHYFQGRCKHLPVIARNCLENGLSSNLWYEEVVPRESLFIISLMRPENVTFDLDKELIQIGANASIGYGLCSFEKL